MSANYPDAADDIQLDEVVVEEDFLKPRSSDGDDEMDITPMIDITFLLLIFFLVTSKMNESAAVDLPQARHGSVVAATEAVVVVMKRGTGEEAEVSNAAGVPFSTDSEVQAVEIAEYIQQQLDAGKVHVIIRAEGSVRHGEIDRVSRAIGESLEDVQLINMAVMEQG